MSLSSRGRTARAWTLSFIAFVISCGGALHLREVIGKTDKPANVTLLFAVEDEDGPVSDLTRTHFSVTQDGEPVAITEWDFSNPDLSQRQQTLLLLDFGGHINKADRASLAAAANIFVDVLKGSGKIGIYVFDGDSAPHEIAALSEEVPEEAFKALENFEVKDNSTNLNGAYRGAYELLSDALRKETLGIGSIVLVSRGPDRAARVARGELLDHIYDSNVQAPRYAVGVGPDAQLAGLDDISTAPASYVDRALDLGKTLFAVAETVKRQGKSYYIVSYCSPARAQDHTLEVTATRSVSGQEGETVEETGTLRYDFSADGFGGGCDPKIPASFAHDGSEGGGGAGGGSGDGGTAGAAPARSSAPATASAAPAASTAAPAASSPAPAP